MIYSKSHPKNQPFDWEGLRSKLAELNGIRYKKMIAQIPEFSDHRIMSGTSPGIESLRTLMWKPVLRPVLGVIAEEMPGTKIENHLKTVVDWMVE